MTSNDGFDHWIAKIGKDGIIWIEPPDDEVKKVLVGLFMERKIRIGVCQNGELVFKDATLDWLVDGVGQD